MIDLSLFKLQTGFSPADADARYETLKGREDVIPSGNYCYEFLKHDPDSGRIRTINCPYWAISDEHESLDNGYCSKLKKGDWETEGFTILWDQIKECGVRSENTKEENPKT